MLRYRTIPVTAFAQNCSIVWCDQTLEAAIIDPGGEVDRLLAVVAELGVQLRAIWLTHAHIDHAGGVAELAERLQVPILGPHPADRFWIDGLPQQGAMFGLPAARPFTPTRWLDEGDTVRIGDCELSVHHCPGHTPGHVIFHAPEAGRVFVGDVLFVGSIGRTDFPGGDHGQLLASIRDRLWPMDDATVFVPGHGPEGTIGQERRSNPFLAGIAR